MNPFATPVSEKLKSGHFASPYSATKGQSTPGAPLKDHREEASFTQTDTTVDPKLMRASEAEFTQLSRDTEKKRIEIKKLKEELSELSKLKAEKELELRSIIKKIHSGRSEGTDLSRKALVFDEIVEIFERKKILQRKPGEPNHEFLNRVRDYILQSSRAKAKLKITQVLEALKQFSSTPLLFSPRRSSTDSHDDHPLSIDEIDLKISENSQDLLAPSYESEEFSHSSRHENKKVLDIKPFLNFLTNFLEDLSDETKEINTESLESAINSLKEGIATIKTRAQFNKSTYRATNARLQSSISENTLNDHSLRIEELSTEFNEIEKLLSQISSKTKDKKIKDNSLKEEVGSLLLEIKSITAGFQNLQQELYRQEQQDKERSDQTKSSEDDELKEKIIGILTKLNDQDYETFPRRNLGQEFLAVGGVPTILFSARSNATESGPSGTSEEDALDDDSKDLTEDISSTPRGEHGILFSSRKTNLDSLRRYNLEDLLSTLEAKINEYLEEFRANYRLQARLAEDDESEATLLRKQEIENKKTDIAILEEKIQENLKKIEELEQQLATSKKAQEEAEAEAAAARAEAEAATAVAKAEAAAARAEAEAYEKKAQEAQERAEAEAAARAEVDAARAKAEAAAAVAEAEAAAAVAEAEAAAARAEAELEKSKQHTENNKKLEQKIQEVESIIQKIQQTIATKGQNPQSQSLTHESIELIKEMIGAISESNKQSLEALKAISTNSTNLIKQTGDAVRDSIQPILDTQSSILGAQQDLIKTTLEQQKHQLEVILTQLTEDRKTSAEEITALIRRITELSQIAQEQQLAFLERMERQQQASLDAMQAQQESLLKAMTLQQETATAERRDLMTQLQQSQAQQQDSLRAMQEQQKASLQAMQEQHQRSLAEMKAIYDERVNDIRQQLLQSKELNEIILDVMNRLSQGPQLSPPAVESAAPAPESASRRPPPPKILPRPAISSPVKLTGPVQMSEKPKDPMGGLAKTTTKLEPAPTIPRTSVVPISSTLLDKQEVVRNFLYLVAYGNKTNAKEYYNGTIGGSSIRNIIDDFFNTKKIKLRDADQAYSLIKTVIDEDLALKDSFKEKQRIIPDNFFKLLLKENQRGAVR